MRMLSIIGFVAEVDYEIYARRRAHRVYGGGDDGQCGEVRVCPHCFLHVADKQLIYFF